MITVVFDKTEKMQVRKITPFSSIPDGTAFWGVETQFSSYEKEKKCLFVKAQIAPGKKVCFNLTEDVPFNNRWSDNQCDFYDYEPVNLKITIEG